MSLNDTDYDRVMNSPEFMKLYKLVSESNVRFRELPEASKRLSIAIMLREDTSLINGLQETLFFRPVPTIQEFLEDPKYLGMSARSLYSYWRNEMYELFDPKNEYYEGIFGGAIGIGKSTVARMAIFYNEYRLTCLREPQITLGLSPETVIATQLMTLTLDKAWWTLGQPIYAMLKESKAFMEVDKERELEIFKEGPQTPFIKEGTYIKFPNDCMITLGSTAGHALGMALNGAMMDESEFRAGSGEVTLDLYGQLKERVRSRLMNQATGKLPKYAFLAMVSSAKEVGGVMSSYTQNIPLDDPNTRVMGRPIWDVKDVDPYKQGYFYVLRGTTTHPSQILKHEYDQIEDGTYQVPQHCEVIRVPNSYRRDFEGRIEKALQNMAGVQTLGHDMPFDDLSKFEDEKLLPEFMLIAKLGDKTPLINKLPNILWHNTISGPKLRRYPNAPRYIHLDLAETTEAGFVVVHKERNQLGETVFVADFACWITSPTRIDLNAIKQLLIDLKDKWGVHFGTISADQFQSSSIRQELMLRGIADEVVYLSVDRTADAYNSLSSLNAEGLVKVGTCPKLKNQLTEIRVTDNKPHTRIRKDIADSLCGGVENARRAIKDYPAYNYEEYGAIRPEHKHTGKML